MSRPGLAVAAVLVAGGVAAGAALTTPARWIVAAGLVLVGAAVLGWADRLRAGRLAQTVHSWTGARGFEPLPTSRDDELARALNELGASHERRGRDLALERPWRRQLVDALVSPSLLFSGELRLLAANDAARALLGIPVATGEVSVVQAVGNAALVEAVRDVRANGGSVVLDAGHGERDLRASVSRIGDETLLIITDLTRERRVEELRRNFVVNASHELKTPVTGIRTLSEAMAITLDRGDLERLRALLARLDQETDRLAELVSDLLDLRRLEEGGPVELDRVDLAERARQVIVGLLHDADERGIDLSVDAPDRAYLAGIGGDIDVIVKNLVHNALRYSQPGGEVEVAIRTRPDTQLLTVRDTGMGIPQHDLGRIFERFYRVDSARSRDHGGTGLGLSIVRHAVERHGGTIRVDSVLGEGTTFTVELPIHAAGRAPDIAPVTTAEPGRLRPER